MRWQGRAERLGVWEVLSPTAGFEGRGRKPQAKGDGWPLEVDNDHGRQPGRKRGPQSCNHMGLTSANHERVWKQIPPAPQGSGWAHSPATPCCWLGEPRRLPEDCEMIKGLI